MPEDVFVVVELGEGALNGRSGIVRYHPAFNDVSSSQPIEVELVTEYG
ncbi:MAG: hypothetical protein WBP47_27040 [Candidatus Promineifilaceae bacterium]|nr:hypothetical protein [Chloroflexota bacterium]